MRNPSSEKGTVALACIYSIKEVKKSAIKERVCKTYVISVQRTTVQELFTEHRREVTPPIYYERTHFCGEAMLSWPTTLGCHLHYF